jgi:peptidoglycan-associated lipoprotein
MINIFKILALLSVLAVTACSSTGSNEEATTIVQTTTETSQPDVQMSEAERQALATTVFYFSFDSAELSTQDRATLVYHAVRLKGSTDLTIRLEGHASEEGTREYNLALGERRGNSIAMFLMANGVARSQIEVVSYGEERPAVVGSTEQDRAKNRRVEIK